MFGGTLQRLVLAHRRDLLRKPERPRQIHEDFSEDMVGWYGPGDWDDMFVNAEVRGWCERDLRTYA